MADSPNKETNSRKYRRRRRRDRTSRAAAGKRCGLFGLSDAALRGLKSFIPIVDAPARQSPAVPDSRSAGAAGKTRTVRRRRKKTSPAKRIAGLVSTFFG